MNSTDPLPSYACGLLHGKPLFQGGCGKPVEFNESYRCYDCTASFHRDCIREHFHRSRTIGDIGIVTLKDALIECLSWMECHCGHPACKRCRATREALEVLARNADYPPSVPNRLKSDDAVGASSENPSPSFPVSSVERKEQKKPEDGARGELRARIVFGEPEPCNCYRSQTDPASRAFRARVSERSRLSHGAIPRQTEALDNP